GASRRLGAPGQQQEHQPRDRRAGPRRTADHPAVFGVAPPHAQARPPRQPGRAEPLLDTRPECREVDLVEARVDLTADHLLQALELAQLGFAGRAACAMQSDTAHLVCVQFAIEEEGQQVRSLTADHETRLPLPLTAARAGAAAACGGPLSGSLETILELLLQLLARIMQAAHYRTLGALHHATDLVI